jgi:hypothetical protein
MKVQTTVKMVVENLPSPPEGYSYDVQRVTPQVIKVYLCHDEANYSYTTEPIRSIHSFIKRDMVFMPRNSEKMRVSSLCHLSELRNQSSWSVINQPTNTLIDLLS